VKGKRLSARNERQTLARLFHLHGKLSPAIRLKAIVAFFKEEPRKIWRIAFVYARANKSLQRTAPVPRMVMPLAVGIESIAAGKRFIVYHVYSRSKAASVMPTLGSGRCR